MTMQLPRGANDRGDVARDTKNIRDYGQHYVSTDCVSLF